jgi:alkanesulfonate monooxygenase SsuD/methylene tetrahydromethanopterin reductase-like flavin-dependent oxidoreductase (luciferase family)
MLDLTARYADVWNGWAVHQRSHPDVVPPLREAVDAACRRVGRDPATLRRTLTVGVAFGERTIWGSEPLTGSPEHIAAAFRGFAREGIEQLQVWLNPMTAEEITELAAALDCLDCSRARPAGSTSATRAPQT